jgi:hypothetical protein
MIKTRLLLERLFGAVPKGTVTFKGATMDDTSRETGTPAIGILGTQTGTFDGS